MNIAFRVDSSYVIGTGHVMRCLALANALHQHGHTCIFICRNFGGNIIEFINKAGYQVITLNSEIVPSDNDYCSWIGASYEQEIHDCQYIMGQHIFDWLIIDHYGIDRTVEEKLRGYVKNIFVIDDLANRKHDCDIILDQNYIENYEGRYDSLVKKSCIKLLGPKYALMRTEFREVRKQNPIRDTDRILVFFGGSDFTNETEKVLSHLVHLNNWQVDVIVGGSNPHKNRIQKICDETSHVNFHCQVTNIAEFMAKATFGIMAGGSTTWERFCMGLPAIVIPVAENQVNISKYTSVKNLDFYLDSKEEKNQFISEQGFKNFLIDIEDKRKKITSLSDGNGILRVVSHLIGKLRDLKSDDLQLIFDWRNQDAVREFMFQHELIEWNNHVDWYNRAKNNENFVFKIFELNGIPTGVVTFNIDAKHNSADWGFYIGELDTVKGAGSILGTLALDYIFNCLNINKLNGEVLDFNLKSRYFHEKLGFELEGVRKQHYVRNDKYYDIYLYGMTRENYKC